MKKVKVGIIGLGTVAQIIHLLIVQNDHLRAGVTNAKSTFTDN